MAEVAANTNIAANITVNVDDICNDPEAIRTKDKVMKKQNVNAMFGSISSVSQFLAGILTTVGMALALPEFLKALAPQAAGAVGGTLSAAFAAIPGTGLAILGAAVIATVIAVGSGYVSSRMYNSATYDALEVNAKHTAREIALELQKSHSQQPEYDQNQRPDGKPWAAVMEAKKEAQIQTQL
jgi:hypothetical protein